MKQFYDSVHSTVQKNSRVYRILIFFALLTTLQSVAVAQVLEAVPETAKSAFKVALKKLDSMQIKDAKLVTAITGTPIFGQDTAFVKSLGYVDTIYREVFKWNGKYIWDFYFISESISLDSFIFIRPTFDIATQQYDIAFAILSHQKGYVRGVDYSRSVSDLVISDTNWIDSDSVANLIPWMDQREREFGNIVDIWWAMFWFGTNTDVQLTSGQLINDNGEKIKTSIWTFNNKWLIYGFDAKTGRLVGSLISSVKEEGVPQPGGIVPNPARELITIPEIQQGSVEIHSMLGSIAVPAREYDGSSIDVSMLPTGTYYVRCTTAQGVIVKPFVIVR